jgi:hypothetical protein
MACIECRCNLTDDVEFAYCNHSMCNMPVCIECAPLHALKETFKKIPKFDKLKNKFLIDALTHVDQRKSAINDILQIVQRKPKTDEEKAIIKCLQEILSENNIKTIGVRK